ncbi:sigma-70 family RNA polymerase sigma factor [Candidatus Poribacteria bacterium]|jgi:RNA polymerase sigma-70 factor, ECF subfamily|nr:sigma-70 family RNA polymerase sigma factor [Candidatus Poribacteria bacterium]MBT5536501.1 sigma-70 family RNA polymerase sigma factor [Candidatus Poribacteria bacterium]MBT5709946.1 sigma-70 family RNA polymerase sigma factor [Candidatus Poribacteria bacterium]MBT7099947.1 sigma-70 family RNA polymerase sigma factor [Candidatus Poribacteria bacterium]MBT7809113.1 sigma-70 family RNA polymerase sigma factor [Candidatus Poribacteria bacterium]
MNAQQFDTSVLGQIEAIRRVGRKRLRRPTDLDDFTHEVIARLYASQDQLRDDERFPHWAAVTAKNLAAEWNRKRGPALRDVPPERSPADPALLAERRSALHGALGSLGAVERDLLVARYVDEASYSELQERHDLSSSAVGVRLHRAKRKLRGRLRWLVASIAALFHTKHARAFGQMHMGLSAGSMACIAGVATTITVGIGYGSVLSANSDGASSQGSLTTVRVTSLGQAGRGLPARGAVRLAEDGARLTVEEHTFAGADRIERHGNGEQGPEHRERDGERHGDRPSRESDSGHSD